MSMYRGAYARPMREIFEEGFDVIRQDASEYAFIGFVGAVMASITVLVPAIVGGPIAISLIAPLVALVAIMTLGACEAALSNVASGLQPDAGTAAKTAAWRTVPLMRPWLLLLALLFSGALIAAYTTDWWGPIPGVAVVPPLVALAALYAYPRSLYTAALFEHDLSSRDALRVSVRLVDSAGGRLWKAWAPACAPAAVIALLTAIAGFDAVAGALVAFFFVAALPAAAVLMSLLFVDTASSAEAEAPVRESPLAGRASAAIRRA
jgi:hypothetical protein